MRDPKERFLEKIKKGVDESDCWIWTGNLSNGYGQFRYGRLGNVTIIPAHRFSYETHVGPIPKGLVIDHLCRVTYCVNRAHLEPVTHAENIRRGVISAVMARRAAERTLCKSGRHEFVGDNIYITPSTGDRSCRACMREGNRRRERMRRDQYRAIRDRAIFIEG